MFDCEDGWGFCHKYISFASLQMSPDKSDYNVVYSPPPFASEALVSLLTGMLQKDPLERLTMQVRVWLCFQLFYFHEQKCSHMLWLLTSCYCGWKWDCSRVEVFPDLVYVWFQHIHCFAGDCEPPVVRRNSPDVIWNVSSPPFAVIIFIIFKIYCSYIVSP